MAYDEYLAERVDRFLTQVGANFVQKKMMGGLVFMVNEKMCVGITRDKKTQEDQLMLRIGIQEYETALKSEHAKKMDFTGKPMRGFIFVGPQGYDLETDLEFWIEKALAYNVHAKKSPSKKAKGNHTKN